MKSRLLNLLGSCFLVMVGLSFVVPIQDAAAFPFHRRVAEKIYKRKVRCEMCHAYGGGTQRNAYGTEYQKMSQRHSTRLELFQSLDRSDSDQDGFSNRHEIEKESNPGDPRSTPRHSGRYARLPAISRIPQNQVVLALPESARHLSAKEVTLTAAQLVELEDVVGAPLDLSDSLPTLYFGAKGKRKIGVAIFRHFYIDASRYDLLVGVNRKAQIYKVVIFKAGEETGSVYLDYFDCLKGHTLTTLPAADGKICPSIPERPIQGKAVYRAIKSALWTINTVLRPH
jgi:hypothetical protein